MLDINMNISWYFKIDNPWLL